MGFDWQNFAGSFINKMTEGIKERQTKAEEYKEQQEAAAQRNAQLVRQRQSNARLAGDFMRKARNLGASDAQLEVALASGKSGVEEFYNTLQAKANEMGQKKLSPDEIAAITNMPTLPSVQATEPFDIDLMAQRTYGVDRTSLPSAPEDDASVLAKLFGVDAKDRVKRELADTPYMEGLSIAEINALAQQDEYRSLMPNATMTFLDVPFFSATEALTFSEELIKTMDDAVEANEARIRNARLNPPEGVDNLTAELEMTQTIKEDAAEKMIEAYADTYQHGGFFDNVIAAKSIISAIGGEELEDLLASYLVEPTPEIEALIKQDKKEKGIEDLDDGDSESESETDTTEQSDSEDTDNQEEETTQTETPNTETEKEALLAKDFPKRPPSTKILSTTKWDREYEGKVDPVTGKAIIVEPRPPEGQGEVEVSVGKNRRKKKISDADAWDNKYAETHFPNGLPKL